MSGDLFTWARKHGVKTEAVIELMDMLDMTRAFMPSDQSSEAAVQAQIRVRASRAGVTLWRNNSGALKDADGRLIRFGLANDSKAINAKFKSSDLIGIYPVKITKQMVGTVFGRFIAIETKKPGWGGPKTEREHAQARFLAFVRANGGAAAFAQSTQDVFGD